MGETRGLDRSGHQEAGHERLTSVTQDACNFVVFKRTLNGFLVNAYAIFYADAELGLRHYWPRGLLTRSNLLPIGRGYSPFSRPISPLPSPQRSSPRLTVQPSLVHDSLLSRTDAACERRLRPAHSPSQVLHVLVVVIGNGSQG